MAITYTWANAESTSLKYVDDSTTPDTEKFVPVAAGNRDYNEYVAWVAEGNVATAYVAPGYEDTASAKTSRSAEISSQADSEIEGLYGQEIKRSQLDSSYELSAAIQEAIKTIYATRDAAIAAVTSAADVTAVEGITVSSDEFQSGEFENDGNTETVDVANSGVSPTAGVGASISAYAAFNGSTGAAFDWTTDTFASFGVSSITRSAVGEFVINFESDFASGAYCVIGSAGDQDHTGVGSSPRCVNVTNRTASAVTILIERTDDGVQDDDGYISLMVMGTLAS